MRKLLSGLFLIGLIHISFAQTLLTSPGASSQAPSVTNPEFGQQQFVDQNTIQQTQVQANADLQQLNLPQQVKQLTQTVQALQGIVEIQGHALQQLQLQVQALTLVSKQSNNSAPTTNLTLPTSQNNTSSPNPNASSDSSLAGEALYLQAYQLVQTKQYTPASKLLQQYLQQQPNSKYAADAHYWLGEISAQAGDAGTAISEFTTLANNYPNSSKLPDAMLKLGIIYYSEGQYAQAKTWYNKVMATYPNSSAAQIAATELQELNKAGY